MKAITFTDSSGVKHPALVTIEHTSTCVNLVYVSTQEGKSDIYGQQLERATSVPKKWDGAANGFYFED